MRRAPFLIAACAFLGCGPSFQALYEGDARFEHCYAVEEDGAVSMQKKADCWRDWTDHYTYGQTRDRVQYASMRYRALTSTNLPTDEGMMSAAPGEGNGDQNGTALAPTNAFAPPPTTAAATPGATAKSTWMTAPASSSSGGSGSGGSWMQTAPNNMLPDANDAGTQLVAPAQAAPKKKNKNQNWVPTLAASSPRKRPRLRARRSLPNFCSAKMGGTELFYLLDELSLRKTRPDDLDWHFTRAARISCYIHDVPEKRGDFAPPEPADAFQAHLDLGMAFVDMRRFSDAVRELEIACRLKPNHEESARLLREARTARDEQAKRG